MNSLSLRVSSVKTGENIKKNAELKTSLVTLPKHYEASEAAYCLEFRNAKKVTEQMAAVKNISQSLTTHPEALEFLTDILFYTTLKHPLRNQIVKLLITAARSQEKFWKESEIISSLSKSIQRLVGETKAQTESSQWNDTITSLSGCFENFESGVKALEQCLPLVFPFLCQSVQQYLTELGVLSSPSVRNEYYLYVHSSIRLILACMQEYSTRIRQRHSKQLKQLNKLCKEIIHDNEMPMDPRTNAGILTAYISKICKNYEQFMQEVKLIKHQHDIVLCIGIINTFNYNDFKRLSADICDVCDKIEEIANANATVPNVLLSAARALYQLSRMLLQFNILPSQKRTLNDVKLILRRLLLFSFCYLEHHMDSVRHICKDLLRNILTVSKRYSFDFLLEKIYDSCNLEPLSLSMKCVVLQQTANVLGAQEILNNCKEIIFSNLFEGHLGRDFMVNNLFEGLMCASHRELAYEEWQVLWVDYILQIAAANDSRLPDIETLIVKAVKCDPRVVHYIIEDAEKTIPLSTKLSVLWTLRKSGTKLENIAQNMQNFSQNLHHAILSNCDETRIVALRLLVETHKTTEMLTQLECEHLLMFLEYNSNCQSPATRQKALGLLSKALMRCEINLMRTLKERTKPLLKDVAEGQTVIEPPLHVRFLKEVLRILVSNLFRGANFSRRSVSLQLLEQAVRVAINCQLDLLELLPAQTVAVLLDTLDDSYESNKELAVSILKLIEAKGCCCQRESSQSCLTLAEIQALLVSVRPLDSVTAAYRLEFYCNAATASAFGSIEEETIYSPVLFAALRWLLELLKQGLATARESILKAAKMNPLYGLLFAIKHLLKRLDFVQLAQEWTWRSLVAALILLCKDLTDIVAPVVNSDSPEGHLPNDFSALPAELTDKSASADATGSDDREHCKILSHKLSKIDLDAVKTTPQMVLLCAWRTVKEVSLILGEIVLHAPIQLSEDSAHFLLTKEQILQMSEHFKLLLAETKHRGAFEQAYVGFSKLCARLWRVDMLDLNSLPMQWLRELITLIALDEQINEKICATRRSAGVPFMVQALITSELQVGTTKSLNYCMQQLFQLCAHTKHAKRSAESRTHALNILRALFRCTDLSDAITEFICEGVMCAIGSYDADTWSEKNSATLLFAALMTRIFGVQRTRDSENLNIRNRMTGRIFFLRYPKLYDFFLNELGHARKLLITQEKAHKVHPLLLLLSRLYPSALEGTESNLQLSKFIPLISSCTAFPEMQTRYLAAKAIVALIPEGEVKVEIYRKCAVLFYITENDMPINLNQVHGQLLQILLLYKAYKNKANKDKCHDYELIGDIKRTLLAFQHGTGINNAVILKVMTDIFVETLSCIESFSPLQKIMNWSCNSEQDALYAAEICYYYPVLRKSFFLYKLHMIRLCVPSVVLINYLLNPAVTHESVHLERAETCFNMVLLLLLRITSDSEELAEFEITPGELDFMRSLDEAKIKELSDELRKSEQLHTMLKQVIKKPIFYPECAMKAYAILAQLDHFDFTLIDLIQEAKKHPGDVKSPLTMCVERLVLSNGVDFNNSQLCLEYLSDIVQPWQPDCLRLKASKIVSHIAVHYSKALEKKHHTFIKEFISLMLALLMDDDYDIRDNAAKTVLGMLPEYVGFDNVVSTMAQRLFLQHTADILVKIEADDSYVLDIFKIITDTQALAGHLAEGGVAAAGSPNSSSIASSTTTMDLEIFDKNETNAFAEPLTVILDSIAIFKNTFSQRAKVMEAVIFFYVLHFLNSKLFSATTQNQKRN